MTRFFDQNHEFSHTYHVIVAPVDMGQLKQNPEYYEKLRSRILDGKMCENENKESFKTELTAYTPSKKGRACLIEINVTKKALHVCLQKNKDRWPNPPYTQLPDKTSYGLNDFEVISVLDTLHGETFDPYGYVWPSSEQKIEQLSVEKPTLEGPRKGGCVVS